MRAGAVSAGETRVAASKAAISSSIDTVGGVRGIATKAAFERAEFCV